MPACAVFSCKKKSKTSSMQKDGVTFHFFPKEYSQRKKWIDACNRHASWASTRTSTICSLHFEPSQFQKLSNNRRRLVLDALPTLFLNDFITKSQENMIQPLSPPPSIAPASTDIVLTPRKKKMVKCIKEKAQKIKRLQSKVQYLKKKVSSLEDILKDLKEKSLISTEDSLFLEKIGIENKELIKRQVAQCKTGKLSRKKFSPELRCFALSLQYYSPKAYIYVRKTFGTTLPHPRTLTKWYSKLDGHPGFTKEALNALKSIKENNPNKNIFGALMFDEMKIKSGTSWNVKAQKYYGYVDMGFGSSPDNSEEATDALVFLLVGINTTWKVPIGFFIIHGINAVQKASLVTKALELIHETGVEVKTLTCDGPKVNIGMAEELGCCMDPNKLQTSFLDPVSGQKIHFFLDVCHMLKLVRNSLEHYQYFLDKTGNKIDWNHILLLHALQEKELFYLANKLRANHIYFKTKVMNVRLAAQLFSKSVSDALLFCQTHLKIPGFQNVEPTAKFLALINDTFDILDSKTCSYGLKKAMSADNFQVCFDILNETKLFLMNLNIDLKTRNNTAVKRINVMHSPRFTGFLGFCVCIESAKSLFEDLILQQDKGISFIPLHKTSQDHIEIFFSHVRSHGGSSENPTAEQFEAIYKKLLVHTQLIRTERGTNCIPLEKISILNCASSVEKINNTASNVYEENFKADVYSQTNIENDIECQIFLSPFGEKVIEYIAGYVTFALSKKIKCNACVKGLLGQRNEKSLIYFKSKGYLMYASNEVLQICRICELIIRQGLEQGKLKKQYTTKFVVAKASTKLIGQSFFHNITCHDPDIFVCHSFELARAVMDRYCDTRLRFLMTKSDPKKCVRHIYSKLIHFKNQ